MASEAPKDLATEIVKTLLNSEAFWRKMEAVVTLAILEQKRKDAHVRQLQNQLPWTPGPENMDPSVTGGDKGNGGR